MKKILALLAGAFLLPLAYGQGGNVQDFAAVCQTTMSGAQITVGTAAASPGDGSTSTTPVSPLATIYTDSALTSADADSIITADSCGNYKYYAVPGYYIEQVCKSGSCLARKVNIPADGGRPLSVRSAAYFSSIQAAIDDLPSTGGVVEIPPGTYTVSTCIDVGSKNVVLRGHGFKIAAWAAFGSATWTSSPPTGSIIKVTSTNNAFCTSGSSASFITLEDLLFLGPGSGTSNGIYLNSTSTTYFQARNVAVVNFYTGWYIDNALQGQFDRIIGGGANTGIYMNPASVGGITTLNFVKPEVQYSATGVVCAGAGIVISGKAVIQNNTLGVDLRCNQSSVDAWFEANTNDIRFNTTSAALNDITISGRSGSTGAVTFTGANAANRVTWANFSAGGVAGPVVPAGYTHWQFHNTNFASAPDCSSASVGCTIYGDSNLTSPFKLGVANNPIFGPTGVGLISASAANISIGRYGSVTADSVNIWSGNLNYGKEDASATRLYIDSATAGVWAGLNFKVFSDQGSTAKFTVLGASGNTTIAGSLAIGSGTAITKHLSGTASLDFDLSGAGITQHDLTITVTGAAAGDVVSLGLPTALQASGIMCSGFVSASDTVTVRCMDVTSSGPNPAAATVRADVWQH
jgi:hypothetical protein